MNPVRRWLRFNVVGVAGMLVQLVTLAGLSHIVREHYLLVSAVAVETAILHNFVAHVDFTWRDRRKGRGLRAMLHDGSARAEVLGALWRFQLSNGAVSLAGNLAVMRLLVGAAHLRMLVANAISIAVCGLVNFWLGDRWAFAARTKRRDGKLCSTSTWCRALAVTLLVLQVGIVVGQEAPAPQVARPALSTAAQQVRDAVAQIPDNGKMTVWMLNGIEYHGQLDAREADHFVLREVDLAQTIALKYSDVKSVKANYGGKGFGGRRVNPRRSAIVGVVIVAGLLTLVLAAVASDKS